MVKLLTLSYLAELFSFVGALGSWMILTPWSITSIRNPVAIGAKMSWSGTTAIMAGKEVDKRAVDPFVSIVASSDIVLSRDETVKAGTETGEDEDFIDFTVISSTWFVEEGSNHILDKASEILK